MKLINNKTLMVALILFSVFGYIVSCTHDNAVAPPPASNTPVITHGTNVHLPGSQTAGDSTSWKFDKSHSSALWSTNYLGAAGLLTGRFNKFGLADVTSDKAIYYAVNGQPLPDTFWAFYENEPSKTYFNGYVQINTSNTGEPGRDTGCNIGNLGTIKIISGMQNLTDSNVAKIKTQKVEFDKLSTDYIVTFSFTWRGKLTAPKTITLTGRLKYIPKAKLTPQNYSVFGLQLKFQFDCREFGITSTSISDKIDIECNMNFKNQ
ncbi:MAG TPA: YceI family protein [Chitinophagaceae bacterium]|nr:YceI family protein [Chitinophagaceae bacterium]